MKLKYKAAVLATLLTGHWLSAPLWADELTIYPKEGQSPEQQFRESCPEKRRKGHRSERAHRATRAVPTRGGGRPRDPDSGGSGGQGI